MEKINNLQDNLNINKKKNKKQYLYCGNCGKYGHSYRYCNDPITSFGIILFSIQDINDNFRESIKNHISNYNDSKNVKKSIKTCGIKYEKQLDIQTFCIFRNKIKFLMIRRKNTLGYIEFIRGRYNIENIDGIIFLFKQMTDDEIEMIGKKSFDELWKHLWTHDITKNSYQNEYLISKNKFEKLKNKSSEFINLDFFIENVKPTWNYAEWGFPKGRRNFQESDYECALREFKEETDFDNKDFFIFDSILPIDEKLIGTNGINYKHIYYLAISLTNKNPIINSNNEFQMNEIGDIGWFTYDEAMKLIRPYHTERKKILTQLYMYIINNIVITLHGNNS